MRLFLPALLLLSQFAVAQVTYLGSVGTPQVVPNPNGGNAGTIVTSGHYCPASGLHFSARGLPLGYMSVNSEAIYFAIAVGLSTAPGVNISGGEFYIPLLNPLVLGPYPVSYLGPGDIICQGAISLPGPPLQNNLLGAVVGPIALPPGNPGPMTIQAFMYDATPNRFFTGNAINFRIP